VSIPRFCTLAATSTVKPLPVEEKIGWAPCRERYLQHSPPEQPSQIPEAADGSA